MKFDWCSYMKTDVGRNYFHDRRTRMIAVVTDPSLESPGEDDENIFWVLSEKMVVQDDGSVVMSRMNAKSMEIDKFVVTFKEAIQFQNGRGIPMVCGKYDIIGRWRG